MSGILERIVRRRRASASSRLGPPPEAETESVRSVRRVNGTQRNGGPPAHAELNGSAAEAPAPQPEPEPQPQPVATEAPPEPQPQPQPQPEPQTLPEPPAAVEPPLFMQRGRVRRRARYLRRLREIQFRDLGGFMVELARFQRERPELVRTKLDSALRTDQELRMLERALDGEQPLREIREAGIGGVCFSCGSVHGSGDRFCAACGVPLDHPAAEEPDAGPEERT